MPGGGKTTIGRLLAKRLGLPFADVDLAIENQAGVSVGDLFTRDGEASFRQLESETLTRLVAKGDSVVATGGGTVLDIENRRLLRERTWPIYLQATLPELWRRVRRNSRRPLLQVDDPYQKLQQIYAERHPIYCELALLTVETGAPPVSKVVDAIATGLAYLERTNP